MVIDMIIDRKEGSKYSPFDFYRYALAECDIFDVFDGLTKAMVSGTEDDVKRELIKYVIEQGYNPEICNYIDSVSWLVPTDESNGRTIVKISEFEKKNGYFGTVTWQDEDLENALEVMEIPTTRENLDKLKENLLMWKNMDRLCEAMTEAGWNFIYNLIDDVFNKDGEADE